MLMWREGSIPVNIQRMIRDRYPLEKNKKFIGLIKDELNGKIMTEFLALRVKMYVYRKIEHNVEEKLYKGTKRCVVAEGPTFDD